MEAWSQRSTVGISDAERLRMFIAGVSDYAIYTLSPEGYVSSWNAGAQRFKGYVVDEIIGQHFSRFYTPEDRAAGVPARALQIAVEQGKFEDEGWRMRKGGSRFWASVVIDPIYDGEGQLIGFSKITRDITERREAAQALERAKEALFQSQKLEAIGKLTGGIAHDFNNLLAVIVSGLELLVREPQSPASAKAIDSMQRAANSGVMLTRQLLSFARQQPLRQEKCNLNRVIGSFEAVLRRVSNEFIVFDFQLEPGLSRVLVDATQFEAAILNLVSNARDAMPDGGRLSIITDNLMLGARQVGNLPAGPYVRLMVKDTGTGMTPDVATRAFEPFFTTKEVGKGTGMGLSQVYGLVQQSGGDMTLETEVGKGTAVSLYLPALAEENSVETAAEKTTAGSDKALVVDDQPDVLDMTVQLFRHMGYDVLSANNGKGAIEILERTPDINVLLTDIRMPGMNGISLAQEARKLIAGIKVVLVSGFPVPSLPTENSDCSEFDFINKPYRTADIVKVLRKTA